MTGALRPILARWPLFAALASAAMLAAAHAFERFGGLPPCTLCLRQREVYWVALAVGLVGFALSRWPATRRWVAAALAAVFLVGVGVAVYHAGAEWKFWPGPAACASTGGSVSADDLMAALGGGVKPPACDEALWVFLGLSMAGWNALISLALAALSLAAARRPAA
ncbi:MAG TPA: disulfide bond formation protein B [Phenylobacterium sp.]|nr:disulfide bond formation protein B [Phenylobacterium sp.]